MISDAKPPDWAEDLLRFFLPAHDFESVSGDLLEEYRETIHAAGSARANFRYLRQVLGFAWRSLRMWAALFAAAFLFRTAIDWMVPTADFHARSTVSTIVGAAILFLAGFAAGSRSGSRLAGGVTGMSAAAIAAGIEWVGVGILLAIRHDENTLAAIRGSGGLEEVFTLPIAMVLPGFLLGSVGGALGAAAGRMRSG